MTSEVRDLRSSVDWQARALSAEKLLHDTLLKRDPQPEARNSHDVLASIANTLVELLAEVKRGNSVAREGAVSSLLIEDNPTKDRIVRVTSKHYAGSVVDVDEALERHGYAHREAERLAMAGWATTVATVAAETGK